MNDTIKIKDKIFAPYILEKDIDEAIDRVADAINREYEGCAKPVVMLVTLCGAMQFAAELNKRLSFPIEWAFVKCSSYGQSIESSGLVSFDVPITMEVEGRDVLVVEDIVDTGATWVALHKYLMDRGVNSLKIASLAIKREVYDKDIEVDFVALELENRFVVGYGFDYGGLGRNLNGIYALTSC